MVNQLPQGWKEVPFNSIFDVCNSGKEKIKQSEYLPKADGLLPVVDQGQNLVSGYSDQFQKVVLAKDNPLIVFGDHTRCVKYIDFDFVVGADGTQLIRTKENTLVKLGYYQLMSANIPNNGYSRHFKYVKEQTYKLIADKDEQDYIVKTLDAVAEMIKLRKETIDLTKKLIPAIFQEMFGDPITNPKGWGKKYLGQVCDVRSGNAFPERYQGYTDGKPFYKVGDISRTIEENHIYLDKAKNYITDEIAQIIKAKSFSKNTIVFAKVGEALRLNRRALISKDAFIDNNVMGVSIKEDCNDLHYLYLYYHFVCNVNLNFIKKEGAIPSVNNKDINSLYLPVPPLSLQKEFAKKVEQINQNLEVQQKDLDRLQELFDQLLQKAFTGEFTRGEDYGKH